MDQLFGALIFKHLTGSTLACQGQARESLMFCKVSEHRLPAAQVGTLREIKKALIHRLNRPAMLDIKHRPSATVDDSRRSIDLPHHRVTVPAKVGGSRVDGHAGHR